MGIANPMYQPSGGTRSASRIARGRAYALSALRIEELTSTLAPQISRTSL